MLASFAPSASRFSESLSKEEPWWMGEKYDGIRSIWNTKRQILYTRRGLEIELPHKYTQLIDCAQTFLDGEIWHGRGLYLESQRIYRENADWPNMRLLVFDDPSPELQHVIFEDRYKHFFLKIPSEHQFLIPAMRVSCSERSHLTRILQSIINDGGEGVILRKPHSLYEQGRTASLVKLKASGSDSEALVVDMSESSALLKLPSGTEFEVPNYNIRSDVKPLLKPGDVVTLEYESHARRDIPMNPKINRIRTDVTWEHVLSDYLNSMPLNNQLNRQSQGVLGYTSKPRGYWTLGRGKRDMRKFFEDFAKSRNFDPLIPENWYSFSRSFFLGESGIAETFHSQGGFARTLMRVFPETSFDEKKFSVLPREHWKEVKNRRSFFDDFAKKNGFDPLVAENWAASKDKLLSAQGTPSVIAYYDNSLINALIHLYPDIGLTSDMLGYWEDVRNRRRLFNQFATETGFDPLVPENWYSVPKEQILATEGVQSVMRYYDNMSQALCHLYPNIGLERSKFIAKGDQLLPFFKQIAEQGNFDPLIPDNWYSVFDNKGTTKWDTQIKGGFVRALVQAFPEIGLSEKSFAAVPSGYWRDIRNRREFFADFAKDCGFDPLIAANWFYADKEKILNKKGVRSILDAYNGSFSEALEHVYPDIGITSTTPTFLPRALSSSDTDALFRERAKSVLIAYAKRSGLDPAVAENWYSADFDTLNELNTKASLYRVLNAVFPDVEFDPKKFTGYWDDVNNRKSFFDDFALRRKFDPLMPQNWYSVEKAAITDLKDGSTVLSYYGGNLEAALISLYPNIGLLPNPGDWQERKILSKYAEKQEFDPLVAENWYNSNAELNAQDLFKFKGGFVRSLMQSFPDIGLQEDKFSTLPLGYWHDLKNRRKLFDEFARNNDFDALVPANWYSISKVKALSQKGVATVLGYYDGRLEKALIHLYPDIGLELQQFNTLSWNESRRRKAFFLDFAKLNGFDALRPENWYSVSKERILSIEGGKEVLNFYENNLPQALMSLFARIGLEKDKFYLERKTPNFWADIKNRRSFLDGIARMRGLDPLSPSTWYSLSADDIKEHKGGRNVLKYHNESLVTAVLELYREIGLEKTKFKKGRPPRK